MRWTQALKNAGALIVAGALDIFAVRWFATFDTRERWARLQAKQAYAYAHGESMCVYDPLPFLHYPSVHAFFVGPVAAYSIIALFIVGWVVWAFAQCLEGIATRKDSRQARTRSGQWR
jgi:hypothetical protein